MHRDLKPQNVVIRRSSNQLSLFLCDFSISILEGDEFGSEMRSFQAGSRGYLAPEVLVGNEYSNKCDVFSFGCLVYVLLSGRKLFSGLSSV